MIEDAARSGAITIHESNLGDVSVRLQQHNVSWASVCLLGTPFQLTRQEDSSSNVLQRAKLDLVVCLVRAGWQAREMLPDLWMPGQREYRHDLSRPQSYFAALSIAETVLAAKGVLTISHSGPDRYYRALIVLEGEKLARLLSDMSDGDVQVPVPPEVRQLEDHADDQPALALDDVSSDAFDIVPDVGDRVYELPPVLGSEFSWCIESRIDGLGLVAKLYFDHCSHQTRQQRVWMDSQHHSCIRYRRCANYSDRKSMAAEFYAWLVAGSDPANDTASAHLAYVPDVATVESWANKLKFVNF